MTSLTGRRPAVERRAMPFVAGTGFEPAHTRLMRPVPYRTWLPRNIPVGGLDIGWPPRSRTARYRFIRTAPSPVGSWPVDRGHRIRTCPRLSPRPPASSRVPCQLGQPSAVPFPGLAGVSPYRTLAIVSRPAHGSTRYAIPRSRVPGPGLPCHLMARPFAPGRCYWHPEGWFVLAPANSGYRLPPARDFLN
jgi:hypothetical protein